MRRSQPHYKPGLLLCALDLMDGGEATASRVPLAPLVAAFEERLNRVGLSNAKQAVMPAWHLATDSGTPHPFWEITRREGKAPAGMPGTTAALVDHAESVTLLPELAAELAEEVDRSEARHAVLELLENDGRPEALSLLEAWPEDQEAVSELTHELESRLGGPFHLVDRDSGYQTSSVSSVIRSRAFRRLVLPAYEHRCALCGLRLRAGELIEVEAAHVFPRRLLGSDDPRNGLALCRTHHWAFDQLLWTIRDDHGVVVRRERGARDDLEGLRGHDSIQLPSDERRHPHADALAWHREQFEAGHRA